MAPEIKCACGAVLVRKTNRGIPPKMCKSCKARGQNRRQYLKHTERYKSKAKEYYFSNRDKQNTAKKERRIELKEIVFSHYGKWCHCPGGCYESREEFLTIDHILNDGKFERQQGFHNAHLWRKIIKENFPDKYRILCMNCNFARRLGCCPHERKIKFGVTPNNEY